MNRRCFLRSLAAAEAAGVSLANPCRAAAQQRPSTPPVAPFHPGEGPNNPIGSAIGIHPGRVAWPP